ncbi:MAG: anti-sigma factor family protein [Pseudomonadota bacterium]
MTRDWTDEELGALADGELAPEREAELRRAMEADPALRRRLDEIAGADALLREAFAAPMSEPVPPELTAALSAGAGEPPPLPRRAPPPRGRAPHWPALAAAASVALIVGFGAGWLFSPERDRLIAGPGEAPVGGPLHLALETAPSGLLVEDGLRPLLTFRDAAGRICREFETAPGAEAAPAAGVACRTPEGRWRVEALAALPEEGASPDAYATASGPTASGAIEATLDALGAGPPLDPETERSLIGRGWRE